MKRGFFLFGLIVLAYAPVSTYGGPEFFYKVKMLELETTNLRTDVDSLRVRVLALERKLKDKE